jgi:hypothetical protein
MDEEKKDQAIEEAAGDQPLLATPQHHIEFFKSSELEQPAELKEHLQTVMTGNPFNKYCIDCKKNKTTHCLIWLGSFVCEGCAINHLNLPNGSMSRCYVKDCFNEQWDDYQLRSIHYGGNKALFEIMKEYDILELDFNKKY